MSNIYIQEPPTNGKVLLQTTVGDIDIELWSKETPRACRNFIQLCLEGYYDGLIFHRVVKDFIAQGGDPTGTGRGGESVYGKPFRDEYHSRLRFTRRGILGMANAGPHDNGSQFFFTLGPAPELNGKHTIFGKVTGNTVYNMLKLGEGETDGEERPIYPQKIIKTKVLANPFEDIVPRHIKSKTDEDDSSKKKKSKSKATKNFKLLSFGDEAEEDEEETNKVSQTLKGKGKSSHDLLDDKNLSSVPAVEKDKDSKRAHSDAEEGDEELKEASRDEEEVDAEKERIRKKLKKDADTSKPQRDIDKSETIQKVPSEKENISKTEELRREVKQLQKELLEKKKKVAEKGKEKSQEEKPPENEIIANYQAERKKYKEMKKTLKKKGSDRESATLAMLAKFQSKLSAAKQFSVYNDEEDEKEEEKAKEHKSKDNVKEEGEDEDEEDDASDLSWLSHKLMFGDSMQKKVLDANIDDSDRYEIFDPRNPLNKRRREASKQTMKQKR